MYCIRYTLFLYVFSIAQQINGTFYRLFSIFRSLVDVLPHFSLLCLLSLHSLLYNVMHSVCRYFSAYIFVHELCFCNVDAMTNYTFITVVSYLSRIANNLIDAEKLSCRSHKQTIWVDCASQQKNGLWFTQQFVEYHHPPYAKCTCDNPFRSQRCHFYIPNIRWKFVFFVCCVCDMCQEKSSIDRFEWHSNLFQLQLSLGEAVGATLTTLFWILFFSYCVSYVENCSRRESISNQSRLFFFRNDFSWYRGIWIYEPNPIVVL